MPRDQEPALTGAEQLVAQGAIVLKAENDRMDAIAIARPRDEAKVKERALFLIEADAEAAASTYYSIPFKEHSQDGNCTGKSDDSCPIKEWVEGIGIEGAREIARLWQNNSSRVYISDEDDEWVYLSGVFLDLETNVRVEVPFQVSKLMRYRSGNIVTLYPAKLAQAVQAGVSKAARNAIVQAIPRHISRAVYEKAKEKVLETGELALPKLLEAFAAFDVGREKLESVYKKPLEELTPKERQNLRGLFTAFREHFLDPKEYFAGGGGAEKSESGPSSDSSGVKPSPSAIAGEAEITGGTQAAEPQSDNPAHRALLLIAEELRRINPELTAEAAFETAVVLNPAIAAAWQTPTPPADAPNEEVSKAGETREKEPPSPEPLTGDAAAMADAEALHDRAGFPSIPVEVAEPERELRLVPEPSQPTPEGVESPEPNDTTTREPIDFDKIGI